MNRGLRRTTLLALLALGTVAISACGGSSNNSSAYNNRGAAYSGSTSASSSTSGGGGAPTASPQQYAQQIATATAPFRAAVNQVGNGSVTVDLKGEAQCAAVAPSVAAAIGKLSPPSVDASLQPQLAAAITKFGSTCAALHDATVSKNANALKSLSATGQADQAAMNAVINKINANQSS